MDYSEIADLMHPGKKTVYKSKYFSYDSKIPEMLKFKRMSKKEAELMFGDKYDAVFELTRFKPVSNKSNDYFLKTVYKAGLLNGRLKKLGSWDTGPVSVDEFRYVLKKHNGSKDVAFFETDKSVRITRGDDIRRMMVKSSKTDGNLRKLIKDDNKTKPTKKLTTAPGGLPKIPEPKSDSVFEYLRDYSYPRW